MGRSVLHDQGLTARILKVVNSVTYGMGRNKITTVSRAAVILGYNTLKHICITAKMIDSMLRSSDINARVHDRLLRLMAKSFHSAMLARMLMGEHSEDLQEEVYIAALLRDLGEIAFWSHGGKLGEKLDLEIRTKRIDKTELIKTNIGTNFDQLSVGLATAWNMGEMMIRSIEDPDNRSPEMRAISLANQYSTGLTDPQSDIDVESCLKAMSKMTDIPVLVLKRQIQHCTKQCIELAESYGAKELADYLDPSAKPNHFETQVALQQDNEESKEEADAPQFVMNKPDELLQLKLLRELTQLVAERPDLNLLVNTFIEGLHRGVGMDRVIVFMVNQTKNRVRPRFISCQKAESIETKFIFPLAGKGTIFDEVYTQHSSHWVHDLNADKWRGRLKPTIIELTEGSPFFISPLLVSRKCLGVIYSDRAETKRPLTKEDYAAFGHFTSQLSLCLSMAVK